MDKKMIGFAAGMFLLAFVTENPDGARLIAEIGGAVGLMGGLSLLYKWISKK